MAGSRRARSSPDAVPVRARGEPGGPPGERGSDPPGAFGRAGRPSGTAKDRALRLLGARWRSRAELRFRLSRLGFDDAEVRRAIDDLERIGLIDDRRFAHEVVKDQTERRLAGDRAIRAALRRKGLSDEDAGAALGAAGDEGARARALAERQAVRLRDVAPEVAHRRILGTLLRRGYGWEVALDATRHAIDEDRLSEDPFGEAPDP